MKLVIGLGNPGDQYLGTRHNLGFVILDEYARKKVGSEQGSVVSWEYKKQLKAEVIKLGELILARPQTYMNNSGLAVKILADYYKINPQDTIAVYDELDLHIGQIKIRLGGAAAGHHGIESIMKHLGTDQFIRVRCGIGHWKTQGAEKRGAGENMDSYVLQSFDETETSKMKKLIKTAIKALNILVEKGLEKAQNQYN